MGVGNFLTVALVGADMPMHAYDRVWRCFGRLFALSIMLEELPML